MSVETYGAGVFLTRYVGPTDRRGSRILVTGPNGERGAVDYNDTLGASENHQAAAVCIFKWGPPLVSAGRQLVGGPMHPRGYAWVIVGTA